MREQESDNLPEKQFSQMAVPQGWLGDVRLAIRSSVAALDEAIRYRSTELCAEFARTQPPGIQSFKFYVRFFLGTPLLWAKLIRLRLARRIWIRAADRGFFANVLVVLDALARARPDCKILVDWTLTGRERDFKYGEVGMNVWDQIFEPLATREDFDKTLGTICYVNERINPFLISRGRDLLFKDPSFPSIRQHYHRVYKRAVQVQSEYVIQQVEEYQARMRHVPCLGVHKRLSLPRVSALQANCRMPGNDEVLRIVDNNLLHFGATKPLIYLATDDLDCARLFVTHFGSQLLYRPEAKRVRLVDQIEVHTQEWDQVTVKDAADVLIDALLLARCSRVLHLSSNITTCVAFINPEIKLCPLR